MAEGEKEGGERNDEPGLNEADWVGGGRGKERKSLRDVCASLTKQLRMSAPTF